MSKKRKGAMTPQAKLLLGLTGLIFGFALCRLFIIFFTMEDSSMQPAIMKGHKMLIARFAELSAGDIVLARHPDDPGKVLLKRIAAGPETTVEIRNKVLYINGEKAPESLQGISSDYRNLPMGFTGRDSMPAVRLDRDSFFLMGDNRDRSYDSRDLGAFKKNAILGKVLYVFK